MVRISWVEIPVKDIQRALAFYTDVFQIEDAQEYSDDVRKTYILVNPGEQGQPGVSINETTNFEPSDKGTLAYFHVGHDLAPYLERAKSAGGAVVAEPEDMGGGNWYALVRDTEGNVFSVSAN